MVEPLRHRQTKGAVTDMFDLKPPRHTSTLPRSPSRNHSSTLADQLFQNAHSRPAPTIQPVRVSLASKNSLNTGIEAEYLSPAQAAPPLAYISHRSQLQPIRPVALASQSVRACAVPVIPNTV